MSSHQAPGFGMLHGGPGVSRPEAMQEQQQAIENAPGEARRRIGVEHAQRRPWWRRLRSWLRR
jgi:hypothetical protein